MLGHLAKIFENLLCVYDGIVAPCFMKMLKTYVPPYLGDHEISISSTRGVPSLFLSGCKV